VHAYREESAAVCVATGQPNLITPDDRRGVTLVVDGGTPAYVLGIAECYREMGSASIAIAARTAELVPVGADGLRNQ
ncbi:MAG: hypothetical protein HOI50_13230, partial [Verrucomicrobia bacterium]|nr:hypothetical protein [Verrucomicrobiota bacterium]